jgi:hypothetical protein
MAKKSKTPALPSDVPAVTPSERQSPVRGRASAARPAGPDMPAPDNTPRAIANDATNLDGWPTHGEIAEAAYRRFLDRGSQHGSDANDWFEAERELRLRSR